MAFYNNGFPQQGYQQGYYPNNGAIPDRLASLSGQYQPQMASFSPVTPNQPANNGVIWVQGEEGAKAYLVAPGASVMLMDSETNTFYLKSSDQSGMPLPLRIFDYTERTAAKTQHVQETSDYVTRSEFSALEDKLNALISEKQGKPTKTARSKEDIEDG